MNSEKKFFLSKREGHLEITTIKHKIIKKLLSERSLPPVKHINQKLSLVDQAHREPSLVIQAHQKHHPHDGSRRPFPRRSSISKTLSLIRK